MLCTKVRPSNAVGRLLKRFRRSLATLVWIGDSSASGSSEATECSSHDGEAREAMWDDLPPPSSIPAYWPFKRGGRGRAEHLGCGVFVSLSVSARGAAAAERISGGQVGQRGKPTTNKFQFVDVKRVPSFAQSLEERCAGLALLLAGARLLFVTR